MELEHHSMDIVQFSAGNRQVQPAPEMGLPSGAPPQEASIGRLFAILWRRRWLILAVVIVIAVPAQIVIFSMAPYYDATALLLIDTRKASFRDLQATIAAPDADTVTVATQVAIIKSPALAQSVVDRLNLTQNADFLRILDAPPSLLLRAERRIGLAPPAGPPMSAAERRLITSDMLLGMITVTNDAKSYIISIRARTPNAKLSTDIANSFGDVYRNYKLQAKVEAIRRANALLEEQMAPVAQRVKTADQAVEDYRAKNGLVVSSALANGTGDGQGGSTVADQQLSQINTQLIQASNDLAMKRAQLAQIEIALKSGRLDAIPEAVSSTLIATLRAQQAQIATQVASLSELQASNNPSLQSARAAASELQQRISSEISKIASSVRSQVDADMGQVAGLRAELAKLQGQVGTESQATITLRQLESEARAARAVYQDYLGRFEQTSSQIALQESDADVVSPAQFPVFRSGPPRVSMLALVVIVAAMLGCLLALLLDRMRPGVRTLEQLETQTGLFGLGFVPTSSRSVRKLYQKLTSPTIYSCSVGQVSSMLQFGPDGYRTRVVLITSAVPNEGKSFFAISLAANVGREGGRALLIDCDMRRPSVAKMLDIANPQYNATGAAVHQGVMQGLDVVCFRPVDPGKHNAVSMTQIQGLLDDARQHYDMIILDAPPVLTFADASVLSLKADGTIMVVRWCHTPVALVTSALKTLSAYGIHVIGGVVTQVKLKEVASADGGRAYIYRNYAA
jgi:succinoglycan biosynthesis transport protein ExoP